MIKVYCYSRCTTCQKAIKWLDSNNVKYELIDLKLNPPKYEEIKGYYELSNLPLRKFFNTSGLKYKELGLSTKLDSMNDQEKLELLSSDGMLIKRPMVILDNKVLLGFKEAEWLNSLK